MNKSDLNENRLISMVAYVIHMHDNWATMFHKKYGDTSTVDMLALMGRNIYLYALFLLTPLELGQFVPCVDGKPIEEPEHYEEWAKYGDFSKHGKSITPFCRRYHEAKERVIFQGFGFTSNDNGKYLSRNNINIHIDHLPEFTIEYMANKGILLTDTKAKQLGLKP